MEFRVLCSEAPKRYPSAHRFGFVLEVKCGELYAIKDWVDLFFVMANTSFEGFRLIKAQLEDLRGQIILDEAILGTRHTDDFKKMMAEAANYIDSLLAKEKKEEYKG